MVSSLRIAERAGVDMDVSRRCVNPRQFAAREGWLKQEALAKTVQSLPENSGVLRPPGTPSFPGAFSARVILQDRFSKTVRLPWHFKKERSIHR